MINVPLLRKALEWAEAENEKPDCLWNQRWWVQTNECGTSYCQAGYIGQLLEDAYRENEYVSFRELEHKEFVDPDLIGDLEGNYHVAYYAEKALGLTHNQAILYFDATNSLQRLKQLFESFTGEKY